MKSWLSENKLNSENLVFTNARKGKLSRDGVDYILKKYIRLASDHCITLKENISLRIHFVIPQQCNYLKLEWIL